MECMGKIWSKYAGEKILMVIYAVSKKRSGKFWYENYLKKLGEKNAKIR